MQIKKLNINMSWSNKTINNKGYKVLPIVVTVDGTVSDVIFVREKIDVPGPI